MVRDVLLAYRTVATESGANLAALRATNPPHHVWVGANLYHQALARSRADVRNMRRERDGRR